jgi:hypothetical protein
MPSSKFDRLVKHLSKKPGVKNPEALAAWIGRKKYGAKKMAQKSAAARESVDVMIDRVVEGEPPRLVLEAEDLKKGDTVMPIGHADLAKQVLAVEEPDYQDLTAQELALVKKLLDPSKFPKAKITTTTKMVSVNNWELAKVPSKNRKGQFSYYFYHEDHPKSKHYGGFTNIPAAVEKLEGLWKAGKQNA